MRERNEHSSRAGETWRDAPKQQRGLPRALALLWRGACLRCPRCGAFRTGAFVHSWRSQRELNPRYRRERPAS